MTTMTLALFGALLSMGMPADDAEEIAKSYRVEKVQVLVTRAHAAKVNQGEVLAYFPDATLLVHQRLLTARSWPVGPGHLILKKEDLKNLFSDLGAKPKGLIRTKLNYDSTDKYKWIINSADVITGLTAAGVPLEANLGVPTGTDGKSDITIDSDQKTRWVGTYLAAQRKTVDADEKAHTFFPPATTTTFVEIGSAEKIKPRLESLQAGMRPESQNSSVIADGDRANASKAGTTLYRYHYMSYPLTLKLEYDGPVARRRPWTVKQEFIVTVPRGQSTSTVATGFTVVPILEAEPERADEGEGEARGREEIRLPATGATLQWDDRDDWEKINNVSLHADAFLPQVAAKLIESVTEQKVEGLQCLRNREAKEPPWGVDGSSCQYEGTKKQWHITSHRDASKSSSKNEFYITDGNEVHVWKGSLEFDSPKKLTFEAKHFPVINRERKAKDAK